MSGLGRSVENPAAGVLVLCDVDHEKLPPPLPVADRKDGEGEQLEEGDHLCAVVSDAWRAFELFHQRLRLVQQVTGPFAVGVVTPTDGPDAVEGGVTSSPSNSLAKEPAGAGAIILRPSCRR